MSLVILLVWKSKFKKEEQNMGKTERSIERTKKGISPSKHPKISEDEFRERLHKVAKAAENRIQYYNPDGLPAPILSKREE